MAKSTPKQQMLLLACGAIITCLICVTFGVAMLCLYFEYDQHVVQMHPSEVNEMLRGTVAGAFAMAAFLGYTTWVVLRNRKRLPNENA